MPDVPALLQQPGALVRVDEPSAPPFSVFSTGENFDLAQRMAKALASSDLVPAQYRDKLANCLIALDIAVQRRQSPLLIMQNMVIIQGRPAWSAQYIIASINSCGLFTPPLRYEWQAQEGSDAWGCRAFAHDMRTGERLDGSMITIGMAKAEGWYGRTGSKWQTMPEQMLRYRAGAFFGRIYAGQITLGLPTVEEVADSAFDPLAYPRQRTGADVVAGAQAAAAEQPRRRGRRTAAAAAPPVEAEATETPAPAPAPAAAPDSGLEPAPHRDTVVETDPF